MHHVHPILTVILGHTSAFHMLTAETFLEVTIKARQVFSLSLSFPFSLKIPPSCLPHPLPSRFVSKIDHEPQTEAINWSDPLLYRAPNLVTENILLYSDFNLTKLWCLLWIDGNTTRKDNIVLDLSNCKGKIRSRLQASYWTWRRSMLQHLHEALVPRGCAVVGSFVAEGVNQLCAGSASQ